MSGDDLSFDLPMTVQDIQKCIPHRYPFLLIDRVQHYAIGESIHGTKNVSACEPLLQGHFPQNPIVPGVVLVECMAQTSAVLGKLTDPETETCLLMEINKTRFRRMVVPGDTLDIFVRVHRRRRPFFWFEGIVKVGDEEAASANFTAKLA